MEPAQKTRREVDQQASSLIDDGGTKPQTTEAPPSDEQEKLQTVHSLLIDNVLTILREGKPLKASMLTAIRQLLGDQDINVKTLNQRGLEGSMKELEYIDLPFPKAGEEEEDYIRGMSD